MKVPSLILGLTLMTLGLSAQVPEGVAAAFKKSYPIAEAVSWQQEGPYFEAHFTNEVGEGLAVFDRQGERVAYAVSIGIDRLPEAVSAAALAQFEGYRTTEADEMQEMEGPRMFRLGLESGLDRMSVIFNAEGQLMDDDAADAEDSE